MARQKSIFKIEGNLDGVSFYKSVDGHLVRKSGGVSKRRILKDPAFARTRENNSEFGANAKAAKTLRDSLSSLVNRAKDPRTFGRLVQVFNKIKNYDEISERGKRKISIGLQNDDAKNFLAKFEFNSRAQLRNILRRTYDRDSISGTVVMNGFDQKKHLLSPEGATHTSFTAASAAIDFDSGESELVISQTLNFALCGGKQDISLSAVPPATKTITVGVLMVEIFQEVNGEQYPLNNGAYNALMILDVV